MKFTLKHAFLNIVRMPARTAICFLITLSTVAVSVVCGHIAAVTDATIDSFASAYPIVATVYARPVEMPDGRLDVVPPSLTLDDVVLLSNTDSVRAYNITLTAGALAESALIDTLPDNSIFEEEPAPHLENESDTAVNAVNNIQLTEAFFSGDSVLTAGELFTESDMRGGSRAIIISSATADRYGLTVGDSITIKVKLNKLYAVYHIRGVYESARGMTCAYIPLADYFKDLAVFGGSDSYLENSIRRTDIVSRLDFLLTDGESIETFITDALRHGFDASAYNISVNDKPYKTVLQGLRDIRTVSLVVLFSVLVVGVAVFILVSVFFSLSRKRERTVLRALGMKNAHISTMFVCEIAVIALVAFLCGIGGGYAVADTALTIIERTSFHETVAQANEARVTEDVREEKWLTLQKTIEISLTDSYTGTDGYILPVEDFTLSDTDNTTRYEVFWSDGESVPITGVVWLDVPGFVNEPSWPHSICKDSHRIGGYSFDCYVPEGSEYDIGDMIVIWPQNEQTTSMMLQIGEKHTYVSAGYFDAYLRVVGNYTSDTYSGVVMPKRELELLCAYAGVTGDVYRITYISGQNPHGISDQAVKLQ